MSAPRVEEDGATLRISGDLNRDTVPELLNRLEPLLRRHAGDAVCIDLRGVSRSDSAGLALLVECRRLARLQQGSLCFEGLSEQMQHMARISGLQDFLR